MQFGKQHGSHSRQPRVLSHFGVAKLKFRADSADLESSLKEKGADQKDSELKMSSPSRNCSLLRKQMMNQDCCFFVNYFLPQSVSKYRML